jgi:hypothetical protein
VVQKGHQDPQGPGQPRAVAGGWVRLPFCLCVIAGAGESFQIMGWPWGRHGAGFRAACCFSALHGEPAQLRHITRAARGPCRAGGGNLDPHASKSPCFFQIPMLLPNPHAHIPTRRHGR